MKTLPYADEEWYRLLVAAKEGRTRAQLGQLLGISEVAVSHVINGLGNYGTGKASTARIADRVIHTFGRFECPYLTETRDAEDRVSVVISADECRAYAHRPVPMSPLAAEHWRACNQCEHKQATAPAQPQPVVVHNRKPRELQS